MPKADLRIVQEAFGQALDTDDGERDAFVAAFERRFPELGPMLRDLLAADAATADGLGPVVAASIDALEADGQDFWIGREIGAWTITERIGSGGMGAVFRAERNDEQYAQTVAVKVMAAHSLEANAVLRFRAERQILARLNHPNIAALIDGGTTSSGLPYLVMELVDGERIDGYCDEHRLGLARRLRLFCKICPAVDYAHRNLVVHRDLKPSNILVSNDGEPKLLDFGIAKLLQPDEFGVTVAETHLGGRAMTPEYASPEQVLGDAISVATDVYALGVLLYRLLTGLSPYGEQSVSSREIEAAIVDLEPRRPSAALQAASAVDEIAARRDTTPVRLARGLAGDLDNIVLKCLHKAPERRYASARELADDVERYLNHEPVLARGDDWVYKARRFAVRHARPIAAASIAIVAIASVVTFYTVRLTEQRDLANLAARQSSEVSSFLTSIFESASPFVVQDRTVTAVDLLEQGTTRVDQLADQPALQAELYRIMGVSFTQLGDYPRAEGLLERSLALRLADNTVDTQTLAESVEVLGEAQRQLRNYPEAIANMRRAYELRVEAHGDEHAEVARVLGRLGSTLSSANRNAEALPTLREALAMKRRLGGPDDGVTADVLGSIAVVLDTTGRYDEAAEAGREVVAMSNEVLGEFHPNTLIRMSNLALVQRRQFALDASASTFAETIRRARQTWPANHPSLAFYTQSHATVLQSLGRFEEALALLEEAADITRAGPGENSLDFVGNLYGLSGWYGDQGDFDEAAAILRRAMDLALSLQAEDGYFVLLTSMALGGVETRAGSWQDAVPHLERVLAHPDRVGRDIVRRVEAWLGLAYARLGRVEEAQALIHRTLAETEGNDEAGQIHLLTTATEYYRVAGDLDESIAMGRRVHRIVEERLPIGNWIAARASAEYAKSLHAAGRKAEARPLIEGAVDALARVFGVDDYRVVRLVEILDEDI